MTGLSYQFDGPDQPAGLDLPEPDGFQFCGAEAYWQLSDGDLMFAHAGEVYRLKRVTDSLDDLEADALAVLAAVAWARRGAEAPDTDTPARDRACGT